MAAVEPRFARPAPGPHPAPDPPAPADGAAHAPEAETEALERLLREVVLERGGPALAGAMDELQAAAAALGDGDPAAAERLPAAEHAHVEAAVAGAAVRFVATDVGLDVLCDAADADEVREALVAAGAVAVGEDAAEVVRVESGRPRYGADLDETVIPQEAGLNERAVSFTKGCYVGQETVARLHYKGKPNRHLRGLRLSTPVPSGTPVCLGEREVGRLGSTVVSPRLGPIALALLRREAEPGAVVAVGPATADVVELPF